ncbi:hypothetical protein [Parabacteroides sp. Marseille-P3160]|uniref:hypothetical protein n=1 Tax=Parabacteroides sp. Marseille-P3160 TaxID=1917887 RepID=UPI0009B97B44|nr:hypothetical protein [Parabacteroides sp. Marseille-P3160]
MSFKLYNQYLAKASKYILFFLFVLYGCKYDKGQITRNVETPIFVDFTKIKETDQSIKLSQFADSILYIRLSDEPLIGDLKHIAVRIFDDTIYLDYDNIFKYSPEGAFLKKIFKEGAGPQEAKKIPGDYAVFNGASRYLIFSNYYKYRFYSAYSFNGDFLFEIDKKKNELEIKHVLAYIDNFEVFSYDRSFVDLDSVNNIIGPYIFYVMNLRDSSIVYKYPSPVANEKIPGRMRGITMYDKQFIQIDSTLWFSQNAIDTLFKTTDFKSFLPKYIFITDKSFFNFRECIQLMVGEFDKSRVMNMKILTGTLPLPDGSLLYSINDKLGYADHTGKASDYSGKPIVNDIDHYLKTIDLCNRINHRTFYVYKNYLYILVDAFCFLDEGCHPPFDDLKEESNPILLKIKLKT